MITAESERIIVDYIKSRGKLLTTSVDIFNHCNLPMSRYTFKNDLAKIILPKYPEIKSFPRRGYYWDDGSNTENKAEEPQTMTKEDFRNGEGYIDSTAAKAIANAMMSTNADEGNQLPGELWERDRGLYKQNVVDLTLVLKSTKGCVNYLIVRDETEKKEYWESPYCFEFEVMGRTYFVDCRMVEHSGQRPFKRYKGMLEDIDLQRILLAIGMRLGTSQTIQTEKIVEKEIPLSDELVFEYLTKSGWLEKHDQELREEIEKTIESAKTAEVITRPEPVADPTEAEIAALKAQVDALKWCFQLVHGGKGGD